MSDFMPLVFGAAGAAIGSAIPGVGTALGWAIGSGLGSVFFPGKLAPQQGPRLTDLKVQTSAYGSMIPIAYGRARMAGNVIWAADIEEHRHTEEAGGKGGPTQEVTTYSYTASFAVSPCEGVITGVRRIWAGGDLIYDAGSGASAQTVVASNAQLQGIRIYTGAESQLPDPTLEAYLGAGNVPAYRGQALVVFTDLALANFGNRIPNLSFEVLASGTASSAETNFAECPPFTYVFEYFPHVEEEVIDVYVSRFGDWDQPAWVDKYSVYLNGSIVYQQRFHNVRDPNPATKSDNGYSNGLSDETGFLFCRDYNSGYPTTCIQAWVDGRTGEMTTFKLPTWFKTGRFVRKDGTIWIAPIATDDYVYQVEETVVVRKSVNQYRVVALAVSDNYVFVAVRTAALDYYIYRLNRTTLAEVDLWLDVTQISGGNLGVLMQAVSDNEIVIWFAKGSPSTNVYRIQNATVVESYSTAANQGGYGAGLRYCRNSYYITASGASATEGQYLRTVALGTSAVTLASVVSNLSVRAGLTAGDIDVTALTANVDGYVIGNQTSVRAALEQLSTAYHFDAVESDDKVKCVMRGGAAAATISADDLVAEEGDNGGLQVTRMQEVELPAALHVIYLNPAADFQQGTQQAKRLIGASGEAATVELPIAMTDATAKALADALLYRAWLERLQYRFATSRLYARLEPTDVVVVDGFTVRLTHVQEGADGLLRFEGRAENGVIFTQAAPAASGPDVSQSVVLTGPTLLALLDIPILRDRDDDAGFYAAACGHYASWRGAVLYKSSDGGSSYQQREPLLEAATIGIATTLLGNYTGDNKFDEANSVTVSLVQGTLASTNELSVLNGANAAVLGAEVFQYKSATLNGDGTYTLSGLLRGRFGTEWAIGGHAIGERFVLASATTWVRISDAVSEIGLARKYKGVSFGASLTATTEQDFTNDAVGLECYAPVLLGGGRNAAGDLTLAWVRRARKAAGWLDYADVALGEDSEAYEVEIYTSGYATLKRTITGLTSATTSYTSAQQVADFGSNQSSVYWKVYQMSATVGRGYAASGVT